MRGGRGWRAAWVSGIAIVITAALVMSGCSDDRDSTSEADDRTSGEVATASFVGEPDGPTMGELVAGTSQVVDGTFVWTDYVYDDHGANTDALDRTDLDAAGGDAVYPEGLENSADIVQVQVEPLEDSTEITVVLETLVDPAVPFVTVQILQDETWKSFILSQLEIDGVTETRIDTDRNTMTARLPIDEAPRDEPWELMVAASVTTPSTRHGFETTEHDLAFVIDEPYKWQDYHQADIIGGKADRTDATISVDWDELDRDSPPDARSPGFHTYLYRSELDLGEGIEPAEKGLQYLGPYQPYLVYLPQDGVDPHRALTLFLHGLEQNHVGTVDTGGIYMGTARALSTELHQLAQFAPDGVDVAPANMTVYPLGRGEGLSYEGIAERDALDVLDDAMLRLDPDPDRIILEGVSMGGIGAFRLGALYPDRFSVTAPVIGFASNLVEPILGNFWNVPLRQINGAKDPLIAPSAARGTTDALDALELGFISWMVDGRGHDASAHVYDCVYAELPTFVRVKDPARVRYAINPELDAHVPPAPVDLGLHHDGAYWVSEMRPAGADVAAIDLTSEAIARPATITPRHVDELGASVDPGANLCGPDLTMGPTGDTWRMRAVIREESGEAEIANRITGTLTNLATATIDLGRTGLQLDDDAELVLESTHTATLTLTGLEPGQPVTVGTTSARADDDGTTTVDVAVGTNQLDIEGSSG